MTRDDIHNATPGHMTYLSHIPTSVAVGRWLVHNNVRPQPLSSNGFRAWLSDPDPERLEVCDCDWAGELEPHYRVKRS